MGLLIGVGWGLIHGEECVLRKEWAYIWWVYTKGFGERGEGGGGAYYLYFMVILQLSYPVSL